MAEAYRDINVRDGEHNVTMPMAQAVVRSLAVNAAKGQHRAQRLFAEMLSTTERQNKQLADEWLNVAMDYKIEWDRELARRDARGITHLPEPLPHPDQVKIDMNIGGAWIEGPVTKEDAAKLEWLAERRDDVCKELEELRQNLETERNEALRKLILDEIERNEALLGKLDPALQAIGYG